MLRTASTLLIGCTVVLAAATAPDAQAGENCWIDPAGGNLICEDGGGTTPDPDPQPRPGKRYVYVTTRTGVGECHYWSDTRGGLDSWDPANDAAIISIVIRTPVCPVVPAVDAEATAWSVFRTWPLDPPAPTLQPEAVGITGLPTVLASPRPQPINHSEVLPDGGTLRVRAEVTVLAIAWGDGRSGRYEPTQALPFPAGMVTHVYDLKTCTAEYRTQHPSGALCHPSLEAYTVTASFTWSGSYDAGGGWTNLGTLTRSSSITYQVEESRGVPIG